MSALVRWAARSPLLAALFAVGLVVAGVAAYLRLPIDAVPDVTNIQVQVVTDAPALSAIEVEAQITRPIEREMAGIPGLVQTRSISKAGVSVVTLVFRDEVDLYFARAQVSQRLAGIREHVAPEVGRPQIGPIATGLGEIYMFELRPTARAGRSAEELRTIVDWQIAPKLRQVRGVVEVIPFGGARKQYRVTLDPARLAAHAISIQEVHDALARDNLVTGGGYIERAGEQVVLRGDGRFRGIEDIALSVVRVDPQGVPIRVGQLGKVDTGPALRMGAMLRDGRGEVVGGSVLMLKGENSRDVVAGVRRAIEELAPHLPAGMSIDPYYDRADFIGRVLRTVAANLVEGAVLVVVCLLLTLGSLRAGLLVAGAIPFALLAGFIGLLAIGYSGNVMSLGAIDFGIVVEGAVVIVEHAITHQGPPGDRERRRAALVAAMSDVARAVAFAVVIVVLTFLPLATLEDVEGRMFRPVVYSLCFMLLGALAYAFVVVPAAAPAVLGRLRDTREPVFARWLRRVYAPALERSLRRPGATLAAAFGVATVLCALGALLGANFLPRVFEGSFAIDVYRPPSVSLSQAIAMSHETQMALRDAPEVETVVDRIGRPEGSIDPSGPEMSDVFIMLKSRADWRRGISPERLAEDLADRVNARVPATIHAFSQPIEMRVNDLIAGARSDVVIKLFADDLDTMMVAGDKVRRALAGVRGATDAKMDVPIGLPSVTVRISRERAARLGVSPRTVLDALQAARAGLPVGLLREGERVFDLVLRVGGERITAREDLARLPVATSQGALVPLEMVADLVEERTATIIGREQLRRRLLVQANVRGRDVVGFVRDARAQVAKLDLPRNVEIVWSGQFENFRRASGRLGLLVPVAIGVIAMLLVMTFGRASWMIVTVLNLPFAVGGGVLALLLRGLDFSIPAGVGFIALCGVSVMNGVVMTTSLLGQPRDLPPDERVRRAALASLRAIASTAIVAAVGFVPAAIATGTGAEVQRPLATVVIGGLVAAMALSLPALPAMLLFVARREAKRRS